MEWNAVFPRAVADVAMPLRGHRFAVSVPVKSHRAETYSEMMTYCESCGSSLRLPTVATTRKKACPGSSLLERDVTHLTSGP
jgi:hypothetical protein